MLKPPYMATEDLTDSALLALARATWPSMHLLDTATVGRGVAWDAELQRCVERDGVVVVTVLGVDAVDATNERTSADDARKEE